MKKYNAYLNADDVSRICKSMDEKMKKIKTKQDAIELCKKIGYDIDRHKKGN